MTEDDIKLMFEQHDSPFYMVSLDFKAAICIIFRLL